MMVPGGRRGTEMGKAEEPGLLTFRKQRIKIYRDPGNQSPAEQSQLFCGYWEA